MPYLGCLVIRVEVTVRAPKITINLYSRWRRTPSEPPTTGAEAGPTVCKVFGIDMPPACSVWGVEIQKFG